MTRLKHPARGKGMTIPSGRASFFRGFFRADRWTPNRVWLGVFAFWILMLSGVTFRFFGNPGVLQALQLARHLDQKQAELARLDSHVTDIEREAALLERSRVFQEREIRRVLGYASEDEIIFDFGSSPNVLLRRDTSRELARNP